MTYTSQKKHRITGLIEAGLFLCLTFSLCQKGHAEQNSSRDAVLKWVQQGAVLLLDESGQPLLAYHINKSLPPASTLKILTSYIAIQELGLSFRAKTEFYQGPKGELGIKGFGDPYLISEEIEALALQFKTKGWLSFTGLRLDATSFKINPKAPGTTTTQNPYDAINSALSVNFNSLRIKRGTTGAVESGEANTPLTPLAAEKGLAVPPGESARINLTDDPKESLLYVAQLFKAIFARHGVEVKGQISFGAIPNRYQLILVHQNSRDLSVVLTGLLKYSNNYIANQLFLILGAQKLGWPGGQKKSLSIFRSGIQAEFHPKRGKFHIIEASGISRKNQLTARLMSEVLFKFKPYYLLLHQHRHIQGVYLKSGTLSGVYNYAGYFTTKRGLRPFVIFLKQRNNRREQVLRALWGFSQSH